MTNFCPHCGFNVPFAINTARSWVCPPCGTEHWVNPVPVVVCVVTDNQKNILCITRGNDPGLGRLAFPGGYVDKAETFEEAGHREFKEELGYDLEFRLGPWPTRISKNSLTLLGFVRADVPSIPELLPKLHPSPVEVLGVIALNPQNFSVYLQEEFAFDTHWDVLSSILA